MKENPAVFEKKKSLEKEEKTNVNAVLSGS